MVARDDELRRALETLRRGAPFRGVVLVGESGTGKSTLARTLATILESDKQIVRFVLGTETGRAVPLGAFYRLVTFKAADAPAVTLAAAQRSLEQEKDLVLVVDDAHLLDPLSATLVHQLAVGGDTRLIVVIRSGEVVPDVVTALWKEQLLLRLDINAFTRAQTGELARGVLDGAVEGRLIDELHNRTGGNLLLLRGLLGAGRETGVLVRTELGWQLRGRLRGDAELYDLLEFRLRSLAVEEREAIEVLATAEVLDWDILRLVSDADAVARLERRGLIQLVSDGSNSIARLNHPVIGEAALRHAGVVRTRQLNSMLAQRLHQQLVAEEQRSRVPDPRTRIQLAQFMMRSDLEPDLKMIIEAATNAMSMSNISRGEELARFAFDRGGGLPAAIVLADAMGWQGRGEEAEAVLAGVEPDGADEWLVTHWGCLRAANLFWVCGDVDQARRVLAAVKAGVVSTAAGRLVEALEVSFAFFCGDVATTIDTGLTVCASDALPIAKVWAAVSTSCALALAGRSGEAHRVADVGLLAAAHSESGPHRFAMGLAEVMSSTHAGDYAAAEQIWERYAALAASVDVADAMVEAMRGLVHLRRGALQSACSAFRASISALSQGFPSPWLMLVAAWHAQAEGARGDGEAAAGAVHRAEQAYGPQIAVFLPELELARAWERASAGQPTAARRHAVRAAQIARQSGMCAVEIRALDTAVRFGDRSHASRLTELARLAAAPLPDAIAAHACALRDHDGHLLDEVADRFADIGAMALAADASAQAAREHARAGMRAKELQSSARAHWLARRFGLCSPATNAAAQPLPITDREREIAAMVAAGLSNREIADRLCVSVRTVEGHLYRIFTKLDINKRDQLAHLVGMAQPGV